MSGNSFPLSELTKRHNVKFGDLTAILLYEGAQSRDDKSSHVIRAAPRISVTLNAITVPLLTKVYPYHSRVNPNRAPQALNLKENIIKLH